MKIGIITYHRAYNYGAYLQACALCNRLNMEKDIQAEIVDFRMKKEINFYQNWSWKKKIKRFPDHIFNKTLHKAFDRAINDKVMVKSDKYVLSDSLEDFQKLVTGKYDVMIAGSDEIWKFNNFRGFPNPYWLIGDLGCRKFSYAASSRTDFSKLGKENLEAVKKILDEFEYIGVRDEPTFREVSNAVSDKSKVHMCCDPSFVYDFGIESRKMSEILKGKAKLDPNKKNVVIMTEDKHIAASVSAKLGRKYNLISVFNWNIGCHNIKELTPLEWLSVLKNADLVLTSFFHATCFSIIFNTPYISFATGSKVSKLEGLFTDEDMSRRLIRDIKTFLGSADLTEKIQQAMERPDFSEYVKERRNGFNEFVEALRDEKNN